MPLKTWAPYERLTAEDLNSAMRYGAGEGNVVGAYCETVGPTVTPFTVNQQQLVECGQPPAGADPLGFWQTGGKLKCPVGYAGLYLLTITLQAIALSGVASSAGHYAQGYAVGTLGAGVQENLGTWHRLDSVTPVQGITASLIRPMAEGEEWSFGIIPRVGDGKSGGVRAWSLVRLGLGVGAIGS